ncbi:MAG: DNRLRE domain-containing protein [Chloroflexi bacterium]|nr:DNRLRE domain-containing protein [Chloroflexota bacterium]
MVVVAAPTLEGDPAMAAESSAIAIGPDGRWTHAAPLLPGAYTLRYRTRNANGNHSPWTVWRFHTNGLPSHRLALAKGYNGNLGAAETALNLWAPETPHGGQRLFKLRSFSVMKGLLQFDLAPLANAPAQEVQRARLVLWTDGRSDPQEMQATAYPLSQPRQAEQATWLHAAASAPWTLPGAAAAPDDYRDQHPATAALTPGAWTGLDVTETVRGWLSGDLTQHGLVLVGQSRGSVEYVLASSDHTQPGYRPTLVVEWTQ